MEHPNPQRRHEDQQRVHAPQPQPQVQPADARPSLITRILRLIEAAYYTSLAVLGRTPAHTALIALPIYLYVGHYKPALSIQEIQFEVFKFRYLIAGLVDTVNYVQDLWWGIQGWRESWRLVCWVGEWFGWRWFRRLDDWMKRCREWAGLEGVWRWVPRGV